MEYPAGANYILICFTASTAHISKRAMGFSYTTHTRDYTCLWTGRRPKTPAPQAVVKNKKQDKRSSKDSRIHLSFLTAVVYPIYHLILAAKSKAHHKGCGIRITLMNHAVSITPTVPYCEFMTKHNLLWRSASKTNISAQAAQKLWVSCQNTIFLRIIALSRKLRRKNK